MARLTSSESRNSVKPFRVSSGAGGATSGAGGATTTGFGFGRDDERGRVIRAVRAAGLSLVVSRFLSSLGRNKHVRVFEMSRTRRWLELLYPQRGEFSRQWCVTEGNRNDRH